MKGAIHPVRRDECKIRSAMKQVKVLLRSLVEKVQEFLHFVGSKWVVFFFFQQLLFKNLPQNIRPGFTCMKTAACVGQWKTWSGGSGGGVTTKGLLSRQTCGIPSPPNHRNKEPNYF